MGHDDKVRSVLFQFSGQGHTVVEQFGQTSQGSWHKCKGYIRVCVCVCNGFLLPQAGDYFLGKRHRKFEMSIYYSQSLKIKEPSKTWKNDTLSQTKEENFTSM